MLNQIAALQWAKGSLARYQEPRIWHPGGTAKDGHVLPLVPMSDICHYAHGGIEAQLRLYSDPPSLQAPGGWHQGQLCIEGFTNVIFMQGDQPFSSCSCLTPKMGTFAVSPTACLLDA
ncbi:hypothetical protein TNCV_1585881 [Trichonephila clavipes]|uniref:Uncharacterized protein n=1 Tax=Trichonephila clavipes TaxID=2585209 RepID=A0A8X6SHT4_TRICX|nr:hypothetical protein TNCV_1585881 [Trichonephila clavipes]